MESRFIPVIVALLLFVVPSHAQDPNTWNVVPGDPFAVTNPSSATNARPFLSPEAREALKKRWQERQLLKEASGKRQDDGGFLANGNIPLTDPRFPKMIELAAAPEDRITALLSGLPFFKNAPEEKRAKFLENLHTFRNRLRNEALTYATRQGIQVASEKQGEFIRAFWTKRMEVEKELQAEFAPRRQQLMKQAQEDLVAQFGKQTPTNAAPDSTFGGAPPKP